MDCAHDPSTPFLARRRTTKGKAHQSLHRGHSSSSRLMGAQADSWVLKQIHGCSSRLMGAQADSWVLKQTRGCSSRLMGAQADSWVLEAAGAASICASMLIAASLGGAIDAAAKATGGCAAATAPGCSAAADERSAGNGGSGMGKADSGGTDGRLEGGGRRRSSARVYSAYAGTKRWSMWPRRSADTRGANGASCSH